MLGFRGGVGENKDFFFFHPSFQTPRLGTSGSEEGEGAGGWGEGLCLVPEGLGVLEGLGTAERSDGMWPIRQARWRKWLRLGYRRGAGAPERQWP